MTIKCPSCQEDCLAPDTTLPVQGREVHCPSCRYTFTVRPHDSVRSETAPPGSPNRGERGPRTPDRLSAAPSPLLGVLQPIPHWMVEVYQTPPPIERPPPSDPKPHLSTEEPSPDIVEKRVGGTPLIVDDTLDEPVVALPQEPSVPASFVSGRHPAVGGYRDRKVPKRWLLVVTILSGLALCAILLLVVVGRQGGGHKAGEAVRSLRALLPFQATEEGTFHFSEYTSDLISRAEGNPPLFVIEGKVTNRHPKPCHSVKVRGILFDQRGKRANEETAYCGNIMTRKELARESEEAIRKRLQNPMGSNLSNFNIQPGNTIPFMLVFFNPPERLSEFSIEIAGYDLHDTPPD